GDRDPRRRRSAAVGGRCGIPRPRCWGSLALLADDDGPQRARAAVRARAARALCRREDPARGSRRGLARDRARPRTTALAPRARGIRDVMSRKLPEALAPWAVLLELFPREV